MRYLKVLSLCGLLWSWGLPLQAAQVAGLYEAEVSVPDQGPTARAAGMAEAMAAVLLKVSGSSAVVGAEVIEGAMANAARYVQQYRYRSEEIPPAERKAADGEVVPQSRLWLWVGFDSASIDNLLRRHGYTVWSAARPATLMWLAVEEGAQRVLVGANDQGLVREVLDAEARRRALPLRLPLLDLTDQAKVRTADVWGGFTDNIEVASQRYEPQALLIGKFYPVGVGWEARWRLRYRGEWHEWRQQAADVKLAIASGVGGATDYLSQRFAESSSLGGDELLLRIEGVTGMSDFRRAHDYLLSLHGVAAVILRRVDATASSFRLQIEGGREAVLQAISMGDLLLRIEPTPEPLPAPVVGVSPPEVWSLLQAPQLLGQDGPAGGVAPLPQQPPVVVPQELLYRLLP
ncbi:MAG: DUF2066 domain-containing protein [Gammaproteobacteria bacterium]|nr:DUF2066 domain-containing protein [Gammaproteobacteria bacterium]